jgi:UDP-N-acetylmuramoyl-L-alanyl-D-glutamate--2,6-diaminopimelate ligase
MKALQDILYKVPIMEVKGNLSAQVNDFFFDSREVTAGSLFVATRGVTVDGHKFIANAIRAGAIAVVCEEFPSDLIENVTWIRVKDGAMSLAAIAANFYDNPADQLRIIAVTGTNGKTTTATLLYELFNALGHPSALLSTVSYRIGAEVIPASHTTPDAKRLHAAFRKMADSVCQFCFMEVSSHALVQQRVAGIPFAGAIFTNITHDHLDFHHTFQEYIRAKKILFDHLGENAFALVNADDRNGLVMLQNTKARQFSFALKKDADFKGRILENTFEGLHINVAGRDAWFRLIGKFNAYNILGIFGAAVLLGMNEEETLLELSRIEGVTGRFQAVYSPDRSITAIVDYAHTPDALRNVLETIRDISSEGGRVITVVGCGGNRDREKRPVMSKIAADMSDLVVLTSDNPREENPADILEEMAKGISITQKKKVMTVENRKEAITAACHLAAKGDIILVAGKGHENYQEIKGVKHPFDDREVLIENFKTLNA